MLIKQKDNVDAEIGFFFFFFNLDAGIVRKGVYSVESDLHLFSYYYLYTFTSKPQVTSMSLYWV